jgi:hypothetical protein
MKTYLADSERDGIVFCHEFDAPNIRVAGQVCEKMGWVLLGPSITDVECPADTMAMLEKSMMKPTIH